jgi:hypothetical protein
MLEQAPQLLVVVGFAETLGMAVAVAAILEYFCRLLLKQMLVLLLAVEVVLLTKIVMVALVVAQMALLAQVPLMLAVAAALSLLVEPHLLALALNCKVEVPGRKATEAVLAAVAVDTGVAVLAEATIPALLAVAARPTSIHLLLPLQH